MWHRYSHRFFSWISLFSSCCSLYMQYRDMRCLTFVPKDYACVYVSIFLSFAIFLLDFASFFILPVFIPLCPFCLSQNRHTPRVRACECFYVSICFIWPEIIEKGLKYSQVFTRTQKCKPIAKWPKLGKLFYSSRYTFKLFIDFKPQKPGNSILCSTHKNLIINFLGVTTTIVNNSILSIFVFTISMFKWRALAIMSQFAGATSHEFYVDICSSLYSKLFIHVNWIHLQGYKLIVTIFVLIFSPKLNFNI